MLTSLHGTSNMYVCVMDLGENECVYAKNLMLKFILLLELDPSFDESQDDIYVYRLYTNNLLDTFEKKLILMKFARICNLMP